MYTYGLVNRGNDSSQFCLRGGGEFASFLLSLLKVSFTPLDSLILAFQTFPLATALGFLSCLIGRCDGVWKWIHHHCNSS